MPAGLPGDDLFDNQGNPNEGRFVIFDGLSGPKDSTFDAKTVDYATTPPTGLPAGWTAERILLKINDDSNISTGGLSTGIGFGAPPIMEEYGSFTPKRFADGNFTDDYVPGVTLPSGSAGTNSTLMYIGGGKSALANGTDTGPLAAGSNGYPPGWYTSQPVPYTAGYAICGAGNGGSRDSGANTGYPTKIVTAPGAVANSEVVETGWRNRSGVALVTGDTVLGSAVGASVVPAFARGEFDDEDVEEEVDVEEEEEADEPDGRGFMQRVKRKVIKKKKVVIKKKK